MSTRPSDGFGWADFYEAAEEGRDWLAEQEALRAKAAADEQERRRQDFYHRRVVEFLAQQRQSDSLSYVRICELEWETGQWTGSWSDYYARLRQAQREDESP